MPSASRIRGRLAHGGVLLVPVHIEGLDVEFLVDTGAAYTALSRDLMALLRLTVDPQHTVTVAPAHGELVTVPKLTLAEVRLGGTRVPDVEALVLAFPQALRLDGLLGMNVLRQFRVTLESDTGTLVLRPLRSVSS